MGRAVSTEPQAHTHRSHLIIYVVLVGVVLVKDQFKELPHSIHINRLEFPGFAARLFIVTEGDIAERKLRLKYSRQSHPHSHRAPQGLN